MRKVDQKVVMTNTHGPVSLVGAVGRGRHRRHPLGKLCLHAQLTSCCGPPCNDIPTSTEQRTDSTNALPFCDRATWREAQTEKPAFSGNPPPIYKDTANTPAPRRLLAHLCDPAINICPPGPPVPPREAAQLAACLPNSTPVLGPSAFILPMLAASFTPHLCHNYP